MQAVENAEIKGIAQEISTKLQKSNTAAVIEHRDMTLKAINKAGNS